MITVRTLLFALVIALGILSLPARAADSVLVFNEINYHPADPNQTEWVELRSLQAVDVDISGWRIDGGISYVFPPNTVVPGGGYIVVAANPAQIPGSYGPFSGQLDNAGERLRLRNLNGRVMDEVDYKDGGKWPIGADGSGATLARRSATAGEGPSHWTTSTYVGGTPGMANFYEGGGAQRITGIAIGDTWKFNDSGTTPPSTWKEVNFDDSGWKSGATLIAGGGATLDRSSLRPDALPDGLLAYWPFDETSGTVANNTVPGQPDGTMVNGASFVNDPVRGRVANFDGVDDRMEVLSGGLPSTTFLPQMTDTNDFTWAAWVWSPVASTGTNQFGSVILGNRSNAQGQDTSPLEFIKIMPIAMQYYRAGQLENVNYTDLPINQWTHMAAVKRGLQIDFYINGVLNVVRPISGGLSTPLTFYVGGDRWNGGLDAEHFQGRVDDAALWTRALSAGEIGGLAGAPPAPPLPDPAEQTTNAVTGPQPRYFRKTFTFTGAPANAALELWPVADDGVIFYLNGVEVWRNNVPVTNEVENAKFPMEPISIPSTALVNGLNVLAAEVYQASGGNTDLLFGAQLTMISGPVPPPEPSLTFHEIAAATDANFYIELHNQSNAAVDTDGWVLRTSNGQVIPLPNRSVPAGGFTSYTIADLGISPTDGLRLFLLAPGGQELRDAREVTNRRRGIVPGGAWGYPTQATPGAANIVEINSDVVINEIFYHAPDNSPEQWIELYNRSSDPVHIGNWYFDDGIDFVIPDGVEIPGNGYIVIAWNPSAFAALHPGVPALGPWSGNLSRKGETITLRDTNRNIVDQVTYADSGRWSVWADGGGSSLELKDPYADNNVAEAWDSSDETSKSTWQNVSYTGSGASIGNDPTYWNELVLGLLDAGECLIDDISVIENPGGANRQLIQNGNFSSGTAVTWRIIGNHHGSIVDDPNQPGNKVLHLRATGATEHMSNHAETTLKFGSSFITINPAENYRISFRAKWLRGSNRLHSRLYFNRLARQTLLNRPTTGGTPGASNSRRVLNLGPTFAGLQHHPVVPPANQPATVSIAVSDPDGVASVELFHSINGGLFSSVAMVGQDGVYSAQIPGQSSGATAQFYIRATDLSGAVSFFPQEGPNSRAMIAWFDNRAQLQLPTGKRPHNFRIIMPTADATEMYKFENVMSNEDRPCTVVYDEREVYYHARVRLKSSEHGRFDANRVGFKLSFGSDEPFLGTHESISLDRSGGVTSGQREILIRAASNAAGGIFSTEDDIARIIPPIGQSGTGIVSGSAALGAAILSKTRFDDEYLDNQWEDGGNGPMFKYELCYPLTETINPVTRAVGNQPENPKIPQAAGGPTGVSVQNLGADKELYRWHWLIRNNRSADNYSSLISTVSAIGQSGNAFQTQTELNIDVNSYLRAYVPAALFGGIDNYLADGSQHNAIIFFPPGRKAVMIPWDLDFLDDRPDHTGNPTRSLTMGGDMGKWLSVGKYKRLYWGHMLDILDRSFNTAFLTKWAQHYSQFGTDDITTFLSYLNARATYARSVIMGQNGQVAPIAPVNFTITTPGSPTVGTPFANVAGDGWINVAEIRLSGSPLPLAVTWVDENSWVTQIPLSPGTKTYTLQAFNSMGTQVGSASITITGTGSVFPAGPGSLVASEIHFNPPGSGDETEFIELLNVTSATLDLAGCHFDEENGEGISYTFPSGVQLAPGARILVVRNRAAFQAAYPGVTNLAPNQYEGALDNSGEEIVLYAASGQEIFRIDYPDNIPGTDGDGRSLVRAISSGNSPGTTVSWRPSSTIGGNPGGADASPFSGNPLDDQDEDGLPLLLEYALGSSDEIPGAANAFISRSANGSKWFFNFTRAINADDAELVIEIASDPAGPWTPAVVDYDSGSINGNSMTERWEVEPPNSAEAFFVRLRATLR